MGEAENQELSEELQFVTACLIGHRVTVQTKSFLLHGTLQAANFDKDYGVVLNVAGDHGNIKIFLQDIAYISAENFFLDLNKDAMLESCTKENHSMVVAPSSAGQSGGNTKAAEHHGTSFVSNTNTDQKGSYTYPPNSNYQPMVPIMQHAQTDNSFQGVQINSQPILPPVSYQPYGVQWQYPGGPFVTYVPPPYSQAARPIQGYFPHQVQGYAYQPQYPQNFDSSYQAPRRHQGPR